MIYAANVKTEYLTNPTGIDFRFPRITWEIQGAEKQSAFQITAKTDRGEKFDSGKIQSSEMTFKMPEFPMKSKVVYNLTVWDENDNKGETVQAFYEMGLAKKDWKAKWITTEKDINPEELQPASYFKQEFDLTEEDVRKKCRLYATAHGCYQLKINDTVIEEFLFAPGVSQYDKRLQYQTYDIARYLKPGKNSIQVSLGDGYYRGELGYYCVRNHFGTDISFLCQMEIDGEVILISDENWLGSQDGPIRENDMKRGEIYDARKEEIKNWKPVYICGFGYDKLVCGDSLPVVEKEHFKGKRISTPNGEIVYDFGQNIAGYVRFTVNAHEGQKIFMVHGETLDGERNFTIENIQLYKSDIKTFLTEKLGREPDEDEISQLRIRQEISYTCKEGKNTFKPTKSVFGFRYIKIETDIDLTDAEFEAIAVYSDMEFLGSFQCGNEKVNRLFQNVVWSEKGNFLEIPTDCPTRERGGFTGDLQIFSHTAMYLSNVYPMLRKFLKEQACTQYEDGCVTMHVPTRGAREKYDGSFGWSDSICIIPYKMYLRTGNEDFLTENYDAMKKWCTFSLNRAKESREFRKADPKPHLDHLADTGYHFGEWLEPGYIATSDESCEECDRTGMPEVGTPFLAFCLRIMSKTAEVLGKKEESEFYRGEEKKAILAFHEYCTDNGEIHTKRQAEYVRPIAMDMLSEKEKKAACDNLAATIEENDEVINTGFLSTHEILRVLTDYGHADLAYRLLLKEAGNSWLGQVRKGATTVWEAWDAIDENGNVKLASLNHYSFGSVVGWLMDRVVGIVVQNGKITIRPYPNKELGYAEGIYHSPYGEIVSKWRYEDDKVVYEITVPCNTTAEIYIGEEDKKTVKSGKYIFEQMINK